MEGARARLNQRGGANRPPDARPAIRAEVEATRRRSARIDAAARVRARSTENGESRDSGDAMQVDQQAVVPVARSQRAIVPLVRRDWPAKFDILGELPRELFERVAAFLGADSLRALVQTNKTYNSLLGRNTGYGGNLFAEKALEKYEEYDVLKMMSASYISTHSSRQHMYYVARALRMVHAEWDALRKFYKTVLIHLRNQGFAAPYWLSERERKSRVRAVQGLPDRLAHKLEVTHGIRYFMGPDMVWRPYEFEEEFNLARKEQRAAEDAYMAQFRANLASSTAVSVEEAREFLTVPSSSLPRFQANYREKRAVSSQSRSAVLPLRLADVIISNYPGLGHEIYNDERAPHKGDTGNVFRYAVRMQNYVVVYAMLHGCGVPGTDDYVAGVMSGYDFTKDRCCLLLDIMATGNMALVEAVFEFCRSQLRGRGLSYEEIQAVRMHKPDFKTLGDLRHWLRRREIRQIQLGASGVSSPLTPHELEELRDNDYMPVDRLLDDEERTRESDAQWLDIDLRWAVVVKLIFCGFAQDIVMLALRYVEPDMVMCEKALEECPSSRILVVFYAYVHMTYQISWTSAQAAEFVLSRVCPVVLNSDRGNEVSSKAARAWDAANGPITYQDYKTGNLVELPRVVMHEVVDWDILNRHNYVDIQRFFFECLERKLEQELLNETLLPETRSKIRDYLIYSMRFDQYPWITVKIRHFYRFAVDPENNSFEDTIVALIFAHSTKIQPTGSIFGAFMTAVLWKDNGNEVAVGAKMAEVLGRHPGLIECLKHAQSKLFEQWTVKQRLSLLLTIKDTSFWAYWRFLVESETLFVDENSTIECVEGVHTTHPQRLLSALLGSAKHTETDPVFYWPEPDGVLSSVRSLAHNARLQTFLLRIFKESLARRNESLSDIYIAFLRDCPVFVHENLFRVMLAVVLYPPLHPGTRVSSAVFARGQGMFGRYLLYEDCYDDVIKHATADHAVDRKGADATLRMLGFPEPKSIDPLFD